MFGDTEKCLPTVEKCTHIASIDIGKKNFAIYIQKLDTQILSSIKNIELNQRYNKDATPTKEMTEILKKVYSTGQTVYHSNNDLTENCDKKAKLDPESYHNMNVLLDSLTSYWDKCSIIVIEEQMQFGKRHNTMAVKLAQHCYSYFCIIYGRSKTIVEFPSYYKTQILGAQKVMGKRKMKAMGQRERKKWAVVKAEEILKIKNETDVWDKICKTKKKDDLADTLLMLEAFKYRVYVDKKL